MLSVYKSYITVLFFTAVAPSGLLDVRAGKSNSMSGKEEIKTDGKIELSSLLLNPEHKYQVLNQIGKILGLSNEELVILFRVLGQADSGYLTFRTDGADIELNSNCYGGGVGVNLQLKFPRTFQPSTISEKSERTARAEVTKL